MGDNPYRGEYFMETLVRRNDCDNRCGQEHYLVDWVYDAKTEKMFDTFRQCIDKIPQRQCNEKTEDPATTGVVIFLVADDPIQLSGLYHKTGEEKQRRVNDDDEVKTQTPTGLEQSKFPPPKHRDLNEKVQSPDEMNPIRSWTILGYYHSTHASQ